MVIWSRTMCLTSLATARYLICVTMESTVYPLEWSRIIKLLASTALVASSSSASDRLTTSVYKCGNPFASNFLLIAR